jgi:CheY-like chemotaxis protein
MTDREAPNDQAPTPEAEHSVDASLRSVRLVGFSLRDMDLLRLFLRRPPGSGVALELVESADADLLIANMSQPEARAAVLLRARPNRTIGIVNQFSSDAAFYQVQQNSQLLYSLAQGITRIRDGWAPPHLGHAAATSASSSDESGSAATTLASTASPPANPRGGSADEPTDTPQLSGAGGLSWQRSLSILVIDDSKFSRVAIQEALSKVGFAVETAESGEEGLRMAAAKHFDVTLVDFEMPGIKGPEVIRRMRALGANTPQLLIMLTSRTGTVDRLRAKIAGCDAYLTKPTKMSEFVTVLTQFATQGRLKRT